MRLKFFFLAFFIYNLPLSANAEVDIGLTLDQHLQMHGYTLTPEGSGSKDNYAIEGFSTHAQREQFIGLLQEKSNHIKHVLEIGLNGGHSAEVFLENCPNLEKFVSIDINWHPYTAHAVKYLSEKYGKKFLFFAGDSIIKVPELKAEFPDQTFDLIFIDGNHNYDYCLKDILNGRALANANTLLLVDDYDNPSVRQAVEKCKELHILQLGKIHHSQDPHGERVWIEARYVY